jgi:hypothetical protein
MMSSTAILLALAIGSVALFSLLFVAILFSMRNRWDKLDSPKQPQNQSDA